MLERLKIMQEQGIFEMIPNDIDLNNLISEATNYSEIEMFSQNIESYIKQLDLELMEKSNVSNSDVLSDFCDKFYYDMFDIYYSNEEIVNGIYQRQIKFGKAGTGRMGLSSSSDVKFKIEERKLFKLINNNYIKLKSNEYFEDDKFYIPFDQLKLMFPNDANNKEVKDTIINACTRLNEKIVHWNFQGTKYKSKLDKEQLTIGKDEKMLDIAILYNPRIHKKGINGEVFTIKGIICKVTNFMEMRYMLKQISNQFPINCLSSKYLEFMLAEILTYYLNLINGGNTKRTTALTDKKLTANMKKEIQKNIKNVFEKSICQLVADVHYYGKEEESTYYSRKINDNRSKAKERIEGVVKALTNVSYELMRNKKLKYSICFVVKNQKISIYDSNNKKLKNGNEIFDDILKIINSSATKGMIFKSFVNGDIKLKIHL